MTWLAGAARCSLCFQPAPRACTARTASRPACAGMEAPVTPSPATAPAWRAGLALPVSRVSSGWAEEGRGFLGPCGSQGWHPMDPGAAPFLGGQSQLPAQGKDGILGVASGLQGDQPPHRSFLETQGRHGGPRVIAPPQEVTSPHSRAAECLPGRLGARCPRSCGCRHGGRCDPHTGSCLCPAGWTGDECQSCEWDGLGAGAWRPWGPTPGVGPRQGGQFSQSGRGPRERVSARDAGLESGGPSPSCLVP